MRSWQWTYRASNTKGQFLPSESQEMIDMRLAHQAQRKINSCPWSLTLNFDQLWKCGHEAPKQVLHKRGSKGTELLDAELRPTDIAGKRFQTVAAAAQEAMTDRLKQADKSKLRASCPRSEFIVGARLGVTAVTSCWGDGALGPLGICIPSNALPSLKIRELNTAWFPHICVFESGSESHFMNAETTLLYMSELVAPVI